MQREKSFMARLLRLAKFATLSSRSTLHQPNEAAVNDR